MKLHFRIDKDYGKCLASPLFPRPGMGLEIWIETSSKASYKFGFFWPQLKEWFVYLDGTWGIACYKPSQVILMKVLLKINFEKVESIPHSSLQAKLNDLTQVREQLKGFTEAVIQLLDLDTKTLSLDNLNLPRSGQARDLS